MIIVKWIKKIIEIIKDHERSFNVRVFVLLTMISEIAVFIAFIGDIAAGEDIKEIIAIAATLILVPLTTFVGFARKKIETSIKITVLGLVFAILPALFFFGGGIEGGGVLWFIFAFLYVGIVLTGAWRNVMLTLLVVEATAFYAIDYFFPEIVPYHSREMFYMDSYMSLILVGMVLCVMVTFQNRLFIHENEIAREAAKEAEELNKSQNRFFSSMSHEIRTPINSILGLNELILREEDASDEIVKDANGIAGSGKMLLALINDILDFSKIEAGSMDIVPVDYEVGNLLSEVVNMVMIKAAEKGLDLQVSVDPNVPTVLYGDEVRIKQILINLLNNAVKYTQKGSVGLHMECQEAGEKSVLIRISVTDTGMGIKADALPHLFDVFRRVDEEKNRYIEGTGLGLSIVKQLIELMDGEITVNSVYGEGSSFNIMIKQGVSSDAKVGDLNIHNYGTASRKIYESRFIAPDVSILIVDDNEMNLEVEKKLLIATKMTIDTALSGKEALEMTFNKRYDVILMDHLMPEMDGITCLEKIRSQTAGMCSATPVVVLTANAGSENRELYRRAGFDGYLLKPVSGEALETALIAQIKEEKLIMNEKAAPMNREISTMDGYSRKVPFYISCSSMADLPESIVHDPRVPILPFRVTTDEGNFYDCFQMDTDELVRYIKSGKDAVSSPPEVSDYIEFFSKYLKKAHHLVYIALTTSMSKDYERAMKAAQSFENVTVINSECLSSATGLLVLIACKLAQQDITLEELVAELNSVKKRLRCSFIMDTTSYMAKRGLVSPGVSRIADAMGLRPSLRVKDDKSGLGGVWMGSRRDAYRKYLRTAIPVDVNPDPEVAFITYVDVPEETLFYLKEEISKMVYFEHIIFQKASAAITSNCGPGSLGVLYFVKGNKTYNIASLLTKEFRDGGVEEDAAETEEAATETKAVNGAENKGSEPEKKEEALQEVKEAKWYEGIEGIDGEIAIKNSGSEDSFKMVLDIFYKSINDKYNELEKYFGSEDWNNYTIKVHALKSSAKLIGAMDFSDEALALEMAGKEGRVDYILDKHEAFMEEYLSFKERLEPICVEKEEDKPVADVFLMECFYEAVGNAAKEMDTGGIEDAFKELEGYAVPEEDKEKFKAIKEKADIFDYDGIIQILGLEG